MTDISVTPSVAVVGGPSVCVMGCGPVAATSSSPSSSSAASVPLRGVLQSSSGPSWSSTGVYRHYTPAEHTRDQSSHHHSGGGLLSPSSNDGNTSHKVVTIPTLVFDPADSPTGSQASQRSRLSTLENNKRTSDGTSDLLVPPSCEENCGQGQSKASRWSQLRTTIRMATAIQGRKPRKSTGLMRQDSFLKRFSTRHGGVTSAESESDEDEVNKPQYTAEEKLNKKQRKFVINPDENFMFSWLGVTTMAVLYNLWTSIAREGFPEIQDGNEILWFALDATCDTIYIADVLVQLRTGYLEKGLIVFNSRKLAVHYLKSKYFVLDMLSLLPLDILQFYIGIHPLIRFPRFLKVYRSYRFSYMVETRTIFPNLWRVANLSHILFLGSHWFAAFYFMISEAEGFVGQWGYPKPTGEFGTVTRKYLKSMYWSTLTLTTIGDLPPPETNYEYVFTIVSYLIGVFVFATIVGQVGNVITNRNASRQEFERLLDAAKAYMRTHNVPMDMQRRVQRWYDYAWSRGRMNGGGDINSLGLLPDKLKTELAIHVNLETLKKVTIFQECSPEFLHDLVLKMKAFIFTPGDLICRKGEVAREMFIIADGLLEVISDSGEVLTQMGAGDFFGEIGILNLDGGVNRRTADVRSVGYSELFVLSRQDVLSALKDHPEAESLIKAYGQKRLNEIEEHKRKRLAEKLQRRKASNNVNSKECSPVHRMIDSSTGLLAQVVQVGTGLGRVPSRSVDNIVQRTKEIDGNNSLETCDLLKRVIQLGRQETRSQGHLDHIQANNLEPPALYYENKQDPDIVAEKKLNIPIENASSDGKRWTNILGKKEGKGSLRKMTNHQGRQYEAVSTDDNESETEEHKAQLNMSNTASLEHIAVVMETEESDLDNTTATPDEPETLETTPLTPDLVQFSVPSPNSRKSSSSSGSSSSANENDPLQPQKPPGAEHPCDKINLNACQSASGKSKTFSTVPQSHPTRHQKAKSVSFDNPLYEHSCDMSPEHSLLRKTLSDDTLQRPGSLDVDHKKAFTGKLDGNTRVAYVDVSAHDGMAHSLCASLPDELNSRQEACYGLANTKTGPVMVPGGHDIRIEMQPLGSGDMVQEEEEEEEEGGENMPHNHTSNASRRLSKDTDETSLVDSVDMGSPTKGDVAAIQPQSSVNEESQPADLMSHNNTPEEGATAADLSELAADDEGPTSPTQSSIASLLLENEPNFGELMTAMKSLLQKKLHDYQKQYDDRIKQLEAESQHKEQRIHQLEQQIQTLQHSLSHRGSIESSSSPGSMQMPQSDA